MNNLSFTVSHFTLTSIFFRIFLSIIEISGDMTQNIGQRDYKFRAT